MSEVRFDAVVIDGHKGAAVEVPFDPAERWSTTPVTIAPGRRGHPVEGKLGKTPLQSHVVARSRKHYLLLDAKLLKTAGASIGDRVKVVLKPAREASRTAKASRGAAATGAARDPRIDAYIAKAAPFAQPILEHFREVIHTGCPEVVESIKWGMPAFEHKGPLCGMAAFKAHATFGFWKASLLAEKYPEFAAPLTEAMGQFGRITSLRDLPPKKLLVQWVKDVARFNEEGIKVTRVKRDGPRKLETPDYLLAAFKKNKTARLGFEALSPSHQYEYLEWLLEAKRDDTRAARLATALEWMAEGKSRNWKYMRKK